MTKVFTEMSVNMLADDKLALIGIDDKLVHGCLLRMGQK
jgi:hypothetical protein